MQAAPCSLCKGVFSPAPNSFTSLLSCSCGHSATPRVLLEHWELCVCSWWDSEHWRIILNHFTLLSWRNTTCLRADLLTAAAGIILGF